MKVTLISIIIFFCMQSNAQLNTKFESSNPKDIDTIVSKVMKATDHQFKLISIDTSKSKHSFAYKFKSGADDLIITFFQYLPDPGTIHTIYRFASIEGNYNEVFPFFLGVLNNRELKNDPQKDGFANDILVNINEKHQCRLSFRRLNEGREIWKLSASYL